MTSNLREENKQAGMLPGYSTAARLWLALAVTALLISSVHVLVIILARSGFSEVINQSEGFFQTALVLHVDFALIVWLLAMAGMIWSIDRGGTRQSAEPYIAASGMLLMLFTPWLGNAEPIITDYVLLLDHPLFLLGLGLFFTGITTVALRYLSFIWRRTTPLLSPSMPRLALSGAALAICCALTAFFLSNLGMPEQMQEVQRYAHMFWGAGHLLQFSYLFLLIAAWDWLLQSGRTQSYGLAPMNRFTLRLLMLLTLCGPLLYLLMQETKYAFTGLMEIAGSLVLLLLLIRVSVGRDQFKRKDSAPIIKLVGYSITLFVAGSLIGFFIQDNNAFVPAHYHGMLGAVTLAFMGLAYRACPLLGLMIPPERHVLLQARCYAGGIGLVMLGLMISNFPRKAMAVDTAPDLLLIVGRFCMAVGGGGALLASLLFVFLIGRALLRAPVAKLRRKALESLE